MTMLTTVQQFCLRTGIPKPATVYGSTDTQVLQVLALLEEEGNDLSARGPWQGITQESTHTTIAAEDQGAMTTIAGAGFRYISNDTMWDRTDRLPVLGPVDGPDWQTLKGFVVTGPRYQFRIRGGKLLVNPTPTAGHTWAFEWISKYWILEDDGSTRAQYFTDDDDTILLPEDLVLMGLRWRWKKEKGLSYEEDFNTYEIQVRNALGRDGGKKTLNMDSCDRTRKPGIFVPVGSWDV